jgi:hypothetical protein
MSLRGTINNKFRESIYCPPNGAGSWRRQVEKRTSISYSLFRVRPGPAGYMPEMVNTLENSELGHNAPVLDLVEVAL